MAPSQYKSQVISTFVTSSDTATTARARFERIWMSHAHTVAVPAKHNAHTIDKS